MSSKNRGRGQPQGRLPNTAEVLERYHRVTGEPTIRSTDGLLDYQESFGVGGKYLAQAVVTQRYLGSGGTIITPIGQYDPARQDWLFAPEYIRSDEAGRLKQITRLQVPPAVAQINAMRVDSDVPVVDVYHPYTTKVRKQMEQLLRPLRVAKLLARPAVREAMAQPDSEVVGADSYTFYYPQIAPVFKTHELVENVGMDDTITRRVAGDRVGSILVLQASGLVVQNESFPGSSFVYRNTRHVTVASWNRAETGWKPNSEVVQSNEWPQWQRIATALEQAAVENPDFSLIHCAVVYGDEYFGARAYDMPAES